MRDRAKLIIGLNLVQVELQISYIVLHGCHSGKPGKVVELYNIVEGELGDRGIFTSVVNYQSMMRILEKTAEVQ